jgi:hypothetical protein
MQNIFDTGSIPLPAWLWLIPLIPVIALADGMRKAVGRRRRPTESEVAAA